MNRVQRLQRLQRYRADRHLTVRELAERLAQPEWAIWAVDDLLTDS